jgi:NAD(P)-dependent dehydrogenase (short-subunit alcohol dehydrogenase family)
MMVDTKGLIYPGREDIKEEDDRWKYELSQITNAEGRQGDMAAGFKGVGPGVAAYVASKHAVLGLTKVASADVARHGIRVNAVCPGAVDTEMFANVVEHEAKKARMRPDQAKKAILSNIGIGRLIQPKEIGRVVAFLCSDDASTISGQAINVDGGNATVNY